MVEASVYVFDPTAADPQSKVRGVGRYVDTMMEALGATGKLVSTMADVPQSAILINPFFNLLAPPLLTKRVARHQVAVIHDMIPFKYPHAFPLGLRGKLTAWNNKKTLPLYDKIITDSVASRDDIVHILRLQNNIINVVYPSIAAVFGSSLAPEPSPGLMTALANRPQYFVYVGDATWNKNLVNLAKAVRLMKIPCVFVGKVFNTASTNHPWQRELNLFRKETENDPLFVFPGFVTNDDLRYLYRHAIANLLVSHDEGFGFSYLEAGSQLCPSVLSDRPVFREISGGNALFCNPEDPKDIADAMKQITESPGGRAQLGQKAYNQSLKYSTKEFRTGLLKVLLL